MRNSLIKRGLILILISIVSMGQVYSQQNEISKDARMQWWKDARFGMFIHWGVYSVPAGSWKGKKIAGFGEWIQHNAEIPSKEYHQLTKQFNPVKFDAKKYVKLAKDAGMKYITITAKHHDGFAMFKSEASDYNIVDATPFDRDPIKELADECHKQGLKICFYYSQEQDWNEVGATGNDWDDYQREDKFQEYLDTKVKPQLTELLTNYGEIGVLWFDTPSRINYEQGSELKALVRKLQPECIISGRLGGGVETDYATPGDNSVPAGTIPGYWEVPATLNDTWGFKAQDSVWKSPETVVPLLFDIASKGGNYLLNIGPTSQGVIPQPSVDIFREVGKWMEKNNEAIYATNASPYKAEFQWGGITTKGHKMYLGFSSWPKDGKFSLDGLITEVKKVYMLTDPVQKELTFKQTYMEQIAQNRLQINLPQKATDPYVSVVVVELLDYPVVSDIPTQNADGNIIIPACKGIPVKNNKPVTLNLLGRGGSISGWTDDEISLNLEFKVEQPGSYKLDLITNETGWYIAITWQGGHIIDVVCNGQKQQVKITRDEEEYNPKSIYYKKIHTYGKSITFDKPGVYTISIDPVDIKDEDVIKYFKGFTLSGIRLIKE